MNLASCQQDGYWCFNRLEVSEVFFNNGENNVGTARAVRANKKASVDALAFQIPNEGELMDN